MHKGCSSVLLVLFFWNKRKWFIYESFLTLELKIHTHTKKAFRMYILWRNLSSIQNNVTRCMCGHMMLNNCVKESKQWHEFPCHPCKRRSAARRRGSDAWTKLWWATFVLFGVASCDASCPIFGSLEVYFAFIFKSFFESGSRSIFFRRFGMLWCTPHWRSRQEFEHEAKKQALIRIHYKNHLLCRSVQAGGFKV